MMEKSNSVLTSPDLQSDKVLAEIAKLEAETQRVTLEVEQLQSERNRTWFKNRFFLQAIIAGLAAIPMIWFIYEKVVHPLTRAEVIKKELALQVQAKTLSELETRLENQEKQSTNREKKLGELTNKMESQKQLFWKDKITFQKQVDDLKAQLKGQNDEMAFEVKRNISTLEQNLPSWIPVATTVQIPESNETLVINKIPLPDNEYRRSETKKRVIMLHVNKGGDSAQANWLSWRNDDRGRIANTYFIERSGSVYEFFEPKYWAYHIGKNLSKTLHPGSISIDVSSWGWLEKRKERYFTYIGKEVPADQVVTLSEPFRGHIYYQAVTEKQYAALGKLLKYLTARMGIPKNFVHDYDHILSAQEQNEFAGILFNTNIRLDKTDAGGFDWERLIEETDSTIQE
ncbi:MAG: hypothetical protein GY799_06310 [Desulfobulbaceae bacterium]|nr:hypothetical protein [Desulfobulbaceae bacterium]